MKDLIRGMGAALLVAALLTVPAAGASAQDQKEGEWPSLEGQAQGREQNPEQARQQMEQMMGPMMGMMMAQMMEGMAKAMAKPEVAESFAIFMRNYYNSLVKQGFTQEEAMKIVTASGIPSMGGKQ